MDIHFNQLPSLHWLWLVACAALLIVWGLSANQRSLKKFASSALIQHLMPSASFGRKITRGVLLVLAMIALVAAMIDPRWGVRYEDVHRRGIDILFVVDVSRSMLAEDVKPNRLERAKQYIADVVEALSGDRVGIISFAGVAANKCPLTVDYGAFRLSLNELTTESSARGGSLLGDALRLAGDSFTDEVKDYKTVIVFSDGEDQGSYPVEAAQKLFTEKGIRVSTVGIGDSKDGSRIPVMDHSRKVYLTHDGQEIWSKMNGDVLRDIAHNGGGASILAGIDNVPDMAEVYRKKIAPAGGRDYETSRVKLYDPQYQWFAGLALGLLLIETWLSERRPIRNTRPINGEVTT